VNVPTDAFKALTAEVERMAAKVEQMSTAVQALSRRDLAARVMYESGRRDERQAILGGPRSRRLRRERPGHLTPVPGEPRTS
jgi:hypothetical protein